MADRISDLFGVPPEEFISARNELARTLKEQGIAEEADRVAKMRKPSIVLWALNQLSRRYPEDVAALREAGATLRTGLSSGDRTEVQAGTQARKSAVARLLDRARTVLAEHDHQASPATIERISRSLYNAAVDEDAAPLLERGELTAEVEASAGGLSDLGFGADTWPDDKPSPSAKEQKARAKADQLEQLAAEAEEHAVQLEKEADALERSSARARSEATRARTSADKARARADRV